MAPIGRRRAVAIRRGIAGLGLAVLACGSDPAGTGAGALQVLFIGNSLTYANDLPGMLSRLGTADGLTIETVDVSQGGYALEDHWGNAASRAALDEGGWDVVILQQGPSSLPESRENLVTWAAVWADAIRAGGATPALYMVWPERARLDVLDDVILSYRTAATEADADLYPAGEAWRTAWEAAPDLPLYSSDDLHPSVMGTYLAALTIYRGLTRRTPPSLKGLGISEADDGILQAAARDASVAESALH
jgi:hypothetical protein